MFDTSRYLTCGVDSAIPLELQLFLWECVEHMPAPKDYLQVFELSLSGSMQSVTHSSEEPEYRKVYMMPSDAPITEKLYIIDDGDHSTMLLKRKMSASDVLQRLCLITGVRYWQKSDAEIKSLLLLFLLM